MNILKERYYSRALLTIFYAFLMATSLGFLAASTVEVKAQSCDNIPDGGGQSISASASIDGTTTQLTDNGFVPAYTRVRLDSIAHADGSCIGMAWNCQTSPCVCQGTGYTYPRTINHTNVTVDISSTGLNGTYSVGTVQFLNAFSQTLDTAAADNTGPNYFTVSYPGTYTFHFQAIINTTACNIQPSQTDDVTITINVQPAEPGTNLGVTSCKANIAEAPKSAGRPVNVTNGNMYIEKQIIGCQGLVMGWTLHAPTTARIRLRAYSVMVGTQSLMNRS